MSNSIDYVLFTLMVAISWLFFVVSIGFAYMSVRLWRVTRVRGSAEMALGFGAACVLSLVSRGVMAQAQRIASETDSYPEWFQSLNIGISVLHLGAQILALTGLWKLIAYLINSSTPAAPAA